MDPWLAQQYEVITTGDGSPSLRTMKSLHFESMHHSGGAWAETLYIYGTALKVAKAQLKGEALVVCSVGLGLGYNELMVAAATLLLGPLEVKIQSFETDAFLVESLLAYVCGAPLDLKLHSIYERISRVIAAEFKVTSEDIRRKLQDMLKQDSWNLIGGISGSTIMNKSWNLIFYDAFSAKTSPELWDENFLQVLLSQGCAREAVFATYACRGSLKRALKNTNFQFVERPGFKGKRNSTLAVRGIEFDLSPYRQISEYIR